MKLARLGLLVVTATGLAGTAHADQLVTRFSAPIFPQVLILYEAEGANLPPTPEGKAALVDAAALTFQYLVGFCDALGDEYAITPHPETADEIAANYSEVARCSYDQFTAKPYWIPQLVDEVDICGRTLGEDWRLPTQADVEALTPSDLEFIQTTLAGVGGESNWGNFYFSLRMYVRATDGTLASADLSPALTGERVAPLPVAPGSIDWARHLESGFALRCISAEVVGNAISQ